MRWWQVSGGDALWEYIIVVAVLLLRTAAAEVTWGLGK